MLKINREYSQTGSPGGINTDEISQDWYLIIYDLENGSHTERKINNFYINVFWNQKCITSATPEYISIISEFSNNILNINSLHLEKLADSLDIKDAYLEQNNQNLFMIEGFYDYSVISYNLDTRLINNQYNLDGYFGNLAQSLIDDSDHFILWNHSQICIVDRTSQTSKSFDKIAKQIIIYDKNKAAILNPDSIIEFYNFNSDSLYFEKSITLQRSNISNFSISKDVDILIYQSNPHDSNGMTILLDIINNKEKVLFVNEHYEK